MAAVTHARSVFISHSWTQGNLAQEVADHLTSMGMKPILDKEEVAAGDEVDEQLWTLLDRSDELLMLCSKEALASSWVMLEVGAAWARRIRIAPIIVDDTAVNDLPGILTRRSVLRYEDIGRYYGQLERRARADDPTEDGVAEAETGVFPAVRQRVVIDGPDGDQASIRDDIGWKTGMERHRGKQATITKIDGKGDGSVLLDVDKGDYWWAVEWLSPVAS